MASDKPRVLLDTNVLLAGNAFPRWPYEVLQHAVEGDFQLVLSPLIIKQAQKHFERRFARYTSRFSRFLEEASYELIPDPIPEEIEANKDLVRDLSDVAIALTAIKAGADYLVSEDKDFTVQDETTARLRSHVKVMLSGTFLREVMGWTGEQLEAIRYRTWDDMVRVASDGE